MKPVKLSEHQATLILSNWHTSWAELIGHRLAMAVTSEWFSRPTYFPRSQEDDVAACITVPRGGRGRR